MGHVSNMMYYLVLTTSYRKGNRVRSWDEISPSAAIVNNINDFDWCCNR